MIKDHKANYWIIVAWFLASFLVTLSPTKQNGMRYFVCIYPALAMMASVGFFYLFKKKDAIIFGSILIFYLFAINLSAYPYFLTYYNELVGGTNGVNKNRLFQIGYWGEGLQEASIWISEQAPVGSKVLINASPNHTTGGKLREDLILTKDNPDYIVLNLNTIWFDKAEVPANYNLVKTVKTAGIPFVQVYQKQ